MAVQEFNRNNQRIILKEIFSERIVTDREFQREVQTENGPVMEDFVEFVHGRKTYYRGAVVVRHRGNIDNIPPPPQINFNTPSSRLGERSVQQMVYTGAVVVPCPGEGYPQPETQDIINLPSFMGPFAFRSGPTRSTVPQNNMHRNNSNAAVLQQERPSAQVTASTSSSMVRPTSNVGSTVNSRRNPCGAVVQQESSNSQGRINGSTVQQNNVQRTNTNAGVVQLGRPTAQPRATAPASMMRHWPSSTITSTVPQNNMQNHAALVQQGRPSAQVMASTSSSMVRPTSSVASTLNSRRNPCAAVVQHESSHSQGRINGSTVQQNNVQRTNTNAGVVQLGKPTLQSRATAPASMMRHWPSSTITSIVPQNNMQKTIGNATVVQQGIPSAQFTASTSSSMVRPTSSVGSTLNSRRNPCAAVMHQKSSTSQGRINGSNVEQNNLQRTNTNAGVVQLGKPTVQSRATAPASMRHYPSSTITSTVPQNNMQKTIGNATVVQQGRLSAKVTASTSSTIVRPTSSVGSTVNSRRNPCGAVVQQESSNSQGRINGSTVQQNNVQRTNNHAEVVQQAKPAAQVVASSSSSMVRPTSSVGSTVAENNMIGNQRKRRRH